MAIDAHEEEAIRALIERHSQAYTATRTPDEVADAVVQAHEDFAGRPVRDFVPVLVERKARAVLGKPPGPKG
ncbi:hypothetical protein ABT127_28075 [Streptomyces sp. NPDC001904]|uniref:three-helix bundle dimerization domain-containing protein n=1 Tax=Streptomyces sp. NPDC001904 TaxID=3154531 RepID=UPI003323E243